MHNGNDDWEENSEPNYEIEDEFYEIECNDIEEPCTETFQLCPAKKNETCHQDHEQYFREGDESQRFRNIQSAPGQLNSEMSNEMHTEQASAFPKMTKLLDCTNYCGSEGLVELIDSNNYETTVLYANYNARKFDGPEEHYNSDSDSEIIKFVNDCAQRKKTPQRACLGVKSGYNLTRHHKSDYFKDPSLRGFGLASIMRTILTQKEQQMLGIVPDYKFPSHRHPEENSSDLRETSFIKDSDGLQEKYSKRYASRNSYSETSKKYDGVLIIDNIKLVPYDDPSAAGDCGHENNINYQTNAEIEDKSTDFMSLAIQDFKQAVLLHLRKLPQFTLENPKTTHNNDNDTCFKSIRLHSTHNSNSKPLLRITNVTQNVNNSFYVPLFPVPTLPLLELQRWTGVNNLLNSSHTEYETPKFANKISHPIYKRGYQFCPKLWHAKPITAHSKLSPKFKEDCIRMWSYKLGDTTSTPCFTPPETSQSEIKYTNIKKIQFAYTSHDSFFSSNNAVKQFEHCWSGFEDQSGSTPSSSTSISLNDNEPEAVSPITSEENVTMHVIQDKKDASTYSSSSSNSSFAVIIPKNNEIASPITSNAWLIHPLSCLQSSRIDSSSYTIIKPTTCTQNRTRKTTSNCSSHPSSENESTTSFTTFSHSGDSTFSSCKTPSRRPSVSTDSDSYNEFYFSDVQMTDKMAFKFMLDENGSEVEISITLPFPIPTAELPNESPLMAAAVLQKAQELVLAHVGFMGTCEHEKGNCTVVVDVLEENTKHGLPALQCSIDMEELYLNSEIQRLGSHINDNNTNPIDPVRRNQRQSVKDIGVSVDMLYPKVDYAAKIISFLSCLFLCKCCRGQLKVFPENINSNGDDKRNII